VNNGAQGALDPQVWVGLVGHAVELPVEAADVGYDPIGQPPEEDEEGQPQHGSA
jgi:hypothetical protein